MMEKMLFLDKEAEEKANKDELKLKKQE